MYQAHIAQCGECSGIDWFPNILLWHDNIVPLQLGFNHQKKPCRQTTGLERVYIQQLQNI